MARRTGLSMMLALLVLACVGAPAGAATPFAIREFALQWEQGEGTVQNYWGPPASSTVPLYEQYVQSPNGQRLVQYFDKGRMESNRPGAPITNGLLTVELITGRAQVGDAQFEQRDPARISVAGDPDNVFPLYSDMRSFTVANIQATRAADRLAGPMGITSPYPAGAADSGAQIVGTDTLTGYHVPRVFSDYRAKTGLLTVGYAVTEPVWVTIKVGGISKVVMVQGFERRVLTYTPSNTPLFVVEFGNIGQHYYNWRHAPGSSSAPVPQRPQPFPPIFAPAGP